MNSARINLILFFLSILAFSAAGQIHKKDIPVRILIDGEENPEVQVMKDTLDLHNFINNTIEDYRSQGYILSGLDSISFVDDTVSVHLYRGDKYEWARINTGNIPASFFRPKYQKKITTGKPVNQKGLYNMMEAVIGKAEENGYPFASIRIDSINVRQNGISGKFSYTPGPLIVFDTLVLVGNPDFVKRSFLENFLNIKEGEAFSQSSVKNIEKSISKLEFIGMKRPPDIYFYKDKCQVGLEIAPRKVNQLDLLIGFMPNSREGNKLLITGLADVSLDNLFRSGKKLNLHWERLQVQTQLIDIRYKHPLLLGSPLSLDARFFLYKQDSSFINRNMFIGAEYSANVNSTFSIYGNFENSNLTNNTLNIPDSVNLLLYNDLKVSYLGMGVNLDYTLKRDRLVRSGWKVQVDGEVGSKVISRNQELDDLVYDGIDLNSIQYKLGANLEGFLPVTGGTWIYLRTKAAKLLNNQLFLNELYRLGGIRTIRGFTENEFYASEYLFLNLEYRLGMTQNSFAYIFFDQSFINNSLQEDGSDNPYGFGLGMNLWTKGGQLNLAFALGGRKSLSPDFSTAKIHFGYKIVF